MQNDHRVSPKDDRIEASSMAEVRSAPAPATVADAPWTASLASARRSLAAATALTVSCCLASVPVAFAAGKWDVPVVLGLVIGVPVAAWAVALLRTILAFWRIAWARVAGRGTAAFGLAFASVAAVLFSYFFAIVALIGVVGRGRQLRRAGRLRLAPLQHDADWSRLELAPDAVPEADRDAVAARWRWNGQTEHASVAAFAQVTLELVALGAPARLLAAASRDAQDEIRHAELCFSLARAIDGGEVGPGPLRESLDLPRMPRTRVLALSGLAVRSLIDGALYEALSARVLAKLARRAADPAIARLLRELAADEGRHAASAWDVIDWCVREGGPPVSAALDAAAEALPVEYRGNLPAPAVGGDWERHGIPGDALEQEEYRRACADVRRRVSIDFAAMAS